MKNSLIYSQYVTTTPKEKCKFVSIANTILNDKNNVVLSKDGEVVLKRLIEATDEVLTRSPQLDNLNSCTKIENNHDHKPNTTGTFKLLKPVGRISQPEVDKILGMAATSVAKRAGSNCLMSIERKGDSNSELDHFDTLVSVFRQEKDSGRWVRYEYMTYISKPITSSTIPIKEILIEAINKKLVFEGDCVVCFENGTLSQAYKGMIILFDVDNTLLNISMSHVCDNFNLDVVESVVKLAQNIAVEGREGKKVGTTFIIGKRQEMEKFGKQMILNPFTGYPEDMRKITDTNLHETIKNFAMLDGAFMIDENGVVLSAGTFIDVDSSEIVLPGFGTRHRCAAAITKKCNCLAIVVSESGGTIRVFKEGKVVLKI